MAQRPAEEWRRLLRRIAFPDLTTDPEQSESWWLSNLLQHTLASLYVLGATGLVQLRATAEGLLRVFVENDPPETADVKDGTAGNSYSEYAAFDDETVGVILIAEDFGLDVSLRNPDAVDQDPIYVPADTGLSLPFKATGFRVKNHATDEDSVWQIIALV